MNGMDAEDQGFRRPRVTRRLALLAPLALAACDTIEGWFETKKDLMKGTRESIGALRRGFTPDPTAAKPAMPPAIRNATWPQAGGEPAHVMGNLELGASLKQAWTADLGEGGGKRRQILGRPVVANGIVYAMDSEATVSAWNLATGAKLWRVTTVPEDSRSSNIGGGLGWDNGVVYAVNGVADILALDDRTGAVKWRRAMQVAARSAPTIVGDRIFLTTIDSRLLALSTADGHDLWSYQANAAPTVLLGSPAPAVSNGLVVAGFGSGDLVTVRAETGSVVWTDNLGVARGKSTLADFVAIRGAPAILNGQIFVTGMGGLVIGADLLTGRRVWERRAASENGLYVAGDWIYLISTDQEAGAINLQDARIAWVVPLPRWENPEKKKDLITWFGPIAAGNRLIVTSTNKEMLSLNPATGETLDTVKLSDIPAPFPPIVADDTLLVVTNDGKLTAYR